MRWLLVIALVGCGAVPPAASRREAASALPQIEAASDIDGKLVGASDAHATMLVMFASWCPHCRHELDVIAALRASHPGVRILGVNYKGHEEYNHQGDAAAVRAYVSGNAPWLRVIPIEDPLFDALGSPPKIPTILIFDRGGALVETFDRRDRPPPEAGELERVLAKLGG